MVFRWSPPVCYTALSVWSVNGRDRHVLANSIDPCVAVFVESDYPFKVALSLEAVKTLGRSIKRIPLNWFLSTSFSKKAIESTETQKISANALVTNCPSDCQQSSFDSVCACLWPTVCSAPSLSPPASACCPGHYDLASFFFSYCQ